MKKFFYCAIAALMAVGCAQHDESDQILCPAVNAPETLYAEAEAPESRTYVENERSLRWTSGDEISYFPAVAFNMQYRYEGESGSNNASFTKVTSDPVTGTALSCNYAVYPYAAGTAVSDEGIISLTLPAEQAYGENSFGEGANTMVCATKNADDAVLRFKNVGGYLKIKLYGEDVTVQSVTLQGKNNEKIAGAATVTAAYGADPEVTMADTATTTVTINCNEGVTLSTDAENPTAFWFVLPEVTFSNGFTITVTDINGGTFEKSTSNPFTIDRNMIQPMKALNAVIEEAEPETPKPANNEIWYTNGSTTTPLEIYDTFDANILSQFYDIVNECWVILFDGEVTKITGRVCPYQTSLTSITLPESITSISNNPFSGSPNLTKFIGKYASEDGRCLIVDGILYSTAFAGLEEYKIPDNVVAIADQGCDCLWFDGFERLIVPENVETIGKYGFAESWYIKEIILEEGVKTIGEGAFSSCHSLQEIRFPSTVTYIGSGQSFSWETKKDIYLYSNIAPTIETDSFDPDDINIFISAKSIPNYCYNDSNWYGFQQCIKGSIEAPIFNNSSEIANNEIRYQTTNGYICAPLYSDESDWGANITAHRYNETLGCWVILFDDEVECVCDRAYFGEGYYCPHLQNLTLPNSIRTIGSSAFVLCGYLKTITIPQNVTLIKEKAFEESGIKTVYCTPITPPTLGNLAFNLNSYTIVEQIYVPTASEASYKRDWLAYASYIFPYSF